MCIWTILHRLIWDGTLRTCIKPPLYRARPIYLYFHLLTFLIVIRSHSMLRRERYALVHEWYLIHGRQDMEPAFCIDLTLKISLSRWLDPSQKPSTQIIDIKKEIVYPTSLNSVFFTIFMILGMGQCPLRLGNILHFCQNLGNECCWFYTYKYFNTW